MLLPQWARGFESHLLRHKRGFCCCKNLAFTILFHAVTRPVIGLMCPCAGMQKKTILLILHHLISFFYITENLFNIILLLCLRKNCYFFFFISKNQNLISRLKIKQFSCFFRNNKLSFFSDFNHPCIFPNLYIHIYISFV